MLLLVFGSSGSGKTTLVGALPPTDGLEVLAPDNDGVPSDADTAWRQRILESVVQRAVARQHAGVDVLVEGQSPLGELLAVPSATELDGIVALLLDCADDERLLRLGLRDPGRWAPAELDAYLGWARWLRAHSDDPAYRQDVLVEAGWDDMRWTRWTAWQRGDPRWWVARLDTTRRPVADSLAELGAWVRTVRASRAEQPLTGRWWD